MSQNKTTKCGPKKLGKRKRELDYCNKSSNHQNQYRGSQRYYCQCPYEQHHDDHIFNDVNIASPFFSSTEELEASLQNYHWKSPYQEQADRYEAPQPKRQQSNDKVEFVSFIRKMIRQYILEKFNIYSSFHQNTQNLNHSIEMSDENYENDIKKREYNQHPMKMIKIGLLMNYIITHANHYYTNAQYETICQQYYPKGNLEKVIRDELTYLLRHEYHHYHIVHDCEYNAENSHLGDIDSRPVKRANENETIDIIPPSSPLKIRHDLNSLLLNQNVDLKKLFYKHLYQ